jgi:hypothetical protein
VRLSSASDSYLSLVAGEVCLTGESRGTHSEIADRAILEWGTQIHVGWAAHYSQLTAHRSPKDIQ